MINPNLERLSAMIFADHALTQTLQALTDAQAFSDAILAQARLAKLPVTAQDLQAQHNYNARKWVERWL
jgi:hypothetical protein